MNIGALCVREVIIARPETTVVEAARLMREHHVGSLVIVDRSTEPPEPIGIVTDRDLAIKVLALAGERGQPVHVRELLPQRKLVSAREDEELEDVLERMRSHGVRRLPVVDVMGRLAGLFAFDDAVDWLTEQLTSLSRLVRRAAEREARERP